MMPDRRAVLIFSILILLSIHVSAVADEVPFRKGDVFVAVDQGKILHFDRSGELRQVLDTTSGAIGTGMCFDSAWTLYTTNFSSDSMSTFSRQGRQTAASWGGPFRLRPESCVFDKKGNIYTGEADGDRTIRKFSPKGKLLKTYQVATGPRGTDWIELAANQCTVFYTSEGDNVRRYDVCRERQLDDFASGLQGSCYALRLRRNGELLVTCQSQVYRFKPDGSIAQTYPISGESLFAMNLDPDGKSFWTAGQTSGNVYQVDIESGSGTDKPLFDVHESRTGRGFLERVLELVGIGSVGGLAVFGEETVGGRAVSIEPTEPPEPEYHGSIRFGEASPVDFGLVESRSELPRDLDLGTAQVEGIPLARVTTDLDLSGAVLELQTPDGWRVLSRSPVAVPLDIGRRRQLPLRLRAGRCPHASAGEPGFVYVEAPDADGKTARLTVPVTFEVEEVSWFYCWWPVLANGLGFLLVVVIIHGFVSPSRFSRRIGVVLSPEEDMEEGFFHPIRAARGSGSGFYRDARLYVSPSFRLTSKSKGALARLRADGKQVKIEPVSGSTVLRQNADGVWEPLPPHETVARFGVTYRNEVKTLFFELRTG